ncbi:sensor histidine kinase [Atopomonas hussainii]|uniref:sensor histidine kinase n=1 Tax=Atopomonas hussainii TaxID=1429083 RepID=UPI0008FFFCF7|nr:ATP-binding protein [Atopomonas hussainii]
MNAVTPQPQSAASETLLTSHGEPDRAKLEQAFALFNQMSAQLSDSYRVLEERVSELKGQLALVSAQRMQELAEKERLANRLQSLLDLLPGAVIVLDVRGVVREANPAARQLLGKPLEGMLWREVIRRDFAPRADDGHEVSLRDGRRVSLAIRALHGEPGQLILLNDLTETRRLQDELARHERLSALGRMVASLAHQVRTPLSSAMLYASHLTEQQLSHEQQQRFAGKLKQRLHELEHQVRDMLVFARGDLPLADSLTVNDWFISLKQTAEPLLLDVPVRWRCRAPKARLQCNRDTLNGAVLNLLENSLQAGGKQAQLKISLLVRDAQLCLRITDNGPGMSAATLKRLGEPFFTSKATGTGLGVAVVKAVVRAHHGQFKVWSREGLGTCMEIILPLIDSTQNLEACA